ncbi:MAG: PD-(D/E)XK nuclease family protein [Elainellaceae cyanobacterium]
MPYPPDLLPTQSAQSVRQGRQSFFKDAQGRHLPSVTTILNATKPREAREALAKWRQRVGPAAAQKISGNASRRGSQTHRQLRRYLLGEDQPCPEAAQPYWQSLQPVLSHIQAVRLVESTVFHYDVGYAGKVDCVASYRGIPCVLDWKTSDRPKGSIDRLYDAPLQLAAYCGAVNHTYETHGIKLSQAAIVVAVPQQEAEVFELSSDLMAQYWQQWLQRVREYYNRRLRD